MKIPITMIQRIIDETTSELIKREEEAIMQAVREVDISVDKEELIRALQYGRNQYEAGVIDGLKLANEAIMRFFHSDEIANGQIKNGLFVASEIIDIELSKRDRS